MPCCMSSSSGHVCKGESTRVFSKGRNSLSDSSIHNDLKRTFPQVSSPPLPSSLIATLAAPATAGS